MQFGHKVANSATPVLNRVYCVAAKKQKLQFATEKAADAFIALCRDTILEQHGYAPVRSYECKACNCYHVSSQQKAMRIPYAGKTKVCEPGDDRLKNERATHRTLNRIEKLLRKAFQALANHCLTDAKSKCEICLDLYATTLTKTGVLARQAVIWDKLNLCVTRIAEEEARLQRALLTINFHLQTILNHQWYMTKHAG